MSDTDGSKGQGKRPFMRPDDYFLAEHIERMWASENDQERRLALRGRFVVASTSTIIGLFVLVIVSANPFAAASLVPKDKLFLGGTQPDAGGFDHSGSSSIGESEAPALASYWLPNLVFREAHPVLRFFGLSDATSIVEAKLRDAYVTFFILSSVILVAGFLFTIAAVVLYLSHREEESGTLNAGVEFTDLADSWGVQQPHLGSVRADFLLHSIIGLQRPIGLTIPCRAIHTSRVSQRVLLSFVHSLIRQSIDATDTKKKLKGLVGSGFAWLAWPFDLDRRETMQEYFFRCDFRRGPILTKSAILSDFGVTKLPLGYTLERAMLVAEQSEMRSQEMKQLRWPGRILGAWFAILIAASVGILIVAISVLEAFAVGAPLGKLVVEAFANAQWFGLSLALLGLSLLAVALPNSLVTIGCLVFKNVHRRHQEECLREVLWIIHDDAVAASAIREAVSQEANPEAKQSQPLGEEVNKAASKAELTDVREALDKSVNNLFVRHNRTDLNKATQTDDRDPATTQDFVAEFQKHVRPDSRYKHALKLIEEEHFRKSRERFSKADAVTKEIMSPHKLDYVDGKLVRRLRYYAIHRDSSMDALVRNSAFYLQFAEGFVADYLNGLGRDQTDVWVTNNGIAYHTYRPNQMDIDARHIESGQPIDRKDAEAQYSNAESEKRRAMRPFPDRLPLAWRSVISAYFATQQQRTANWNLWFRVKRCERYFIAGIILVLCAVGSVASLRGMAALDSPPGNRVHFGGKDGEPVEPMSVGSSGPRNITGSISDLITIQQQNLLTTQTVTSTTNTTAITDQSNDYAPEISSDSQIHLHGGDRSRSVTQERRVVEDD